MPRPPGRRSPGGGTAPWDRGSRPRAVRLQPEPELELVGRQGDEKGREVRVGDGIQAGRSGAAIDEVELAVADRLGALVEHVLQGMAQAGAAGRAVRPTDSRQPTGI